MCPLKGKTPLPELVVAPSYLDQPQNTDSIPNKINNYAPSEFCGNLLLPEMQKLNPPKLCSVHKGHRQEGWTLCSK